MSDIPPWHIMLAQIGLFVFASVLLTWDKVSGGSLFAAIPVLMGFFGFFVLGAIGLVKSALFGVQKEISGSLGLLFILSAFFVSVFLPMNVMGWLADSISGLMG